MATDDRPEQGHAPLSPEARRQLDAELGALRDRRDELTASLGDVAPAGDQGDQANALERTMELERVKERVAEVSWLLERADETGDEPPADTATVGTTVTVRFPDGTVEPLRISDLIEENQEIMVVTPDSPLGRELLGRSTGDSVTYDAPGGRTTVQVMSVRRTT